MHLAVHDCVKVLLGETFAAIFRDTTTTTNNAQHSAILNDEDHDTMKLLEISKLQLFQYLLMLHCETKKNDAFITTKNRLHTTGMVDNKLPILATNIAKIGVHGCIEQQNALVELIHLFPKLTNHQPQKQNEEKDGQVVRHNVHIHEHISWILSNYLCMIELYYLLRDQKTRLRRSDAFGNYLTKKRKMTLRNRAGLFCGGHKVPKPPRFCFGQSSSQSQQQVASLSPASTTTGSGRKGHRTTLKCESNGSDLANERLCRWTETEEDMIKRIACKMLKIQLIVFIMYHHNNFKLDFLFSNGNPETENTIDTTTTNHDNTGNLQQLLSIQCANLWSNNCMFSEIEIDKTTDDILSPWIDSLPFSAILHFMTIIEFSYKKKFAHSTTTIPTTIIGGSVEENMGQDPTNHNKRKQMDSSTNILVDNSVKRARVVYNENGKQQSQYVDNFHKHCMPRFSISHTLLSTMNDSQCKDELLLQQQQPQQPKNLMKKRSRAHFSILDAEFVYHVLCQKVVLLLRLYHSAMVAHLMKTNHELLGYRMNHFSRGPFLAQTTNNGEEQPSAMPGKRHEYVAKIANDSSQKKNNDEDLWYEVCYYASLHNSDKIGSANPPKSGGGNEVPVPLQQQQANRDGNAVNVVEIKRKRYSLRNAHISQKLDLRPNAFPRQTSRNSKNIRSSTHNKHSSQTMHITENYNISQTKLPDKMMSDITNMIQKVCSPVHDSTTKSQKISYPSLSSKTRDQEYAHSDWNTMKFPALTSEVIWKSLLQSYNINLNFFELPSSSHANANVTKQPPTLAQAHASPVVITAQKQQPQQQHNVRELRSSHPLSIKLPNYHSIQRHIELMDKCLHKCFLDLVNNVVFTFQSKNILQRMATLAAQNMESRVSNYSHKSQEGLQENEQYNNKNKTEHSHKKLCTTNVRATSRDNNNHMSCLDDDIDMTILSPYNHLHDTTNNDEPQSSHHRPVSITSPTPLWLDLSMIYLQMGERPSAALLQICRVLECFCVSELVSRGDFIFCGPYIQGQMENRGSKVIYQIHSNHKMQSIDSGMNEKAKNYGSDSSGSGGNQRVLRGPKYEGTGSPTILQSHHPHDLYCENTQFQHLLSELLAQVPSLTRSQRTSESGLRSKISSECDFLKRPPTLIEMDVIITSLLFCLSDSQVSHIYKSDKITEQFAIYRKDRAKLMQSIADPNHQYLKSHNLQSYHDLVCNKSGNSGSGSSKKAPKIQEQVQVQVQDDENDGNHQPFPSPFREQILTTNNINVNEVINIHEQTMWPQSYGIIAEIMSVDPETNVFAETFYTTPTLESRLYPSSIRTSTSTATKQHNNTTTTSPLCTITVGDVATNIMMDESDHLPTICKSPSLASTTSSLSCRDDTSNIIELYRDVLKKIIPEIIHVLSNTVQSLMSKKEFCMLKPKEKKCSVASSPICFKGTTKTTEAVKMQLRSRHQTKVSVAEQSPLSSHMDDTISCPESPHVCHMCNQHMKKGNRKNKKCGCELKHENSRMDSGVNANCVLSFSQESLFREIIQSIIGFLVLLNWCEVDREHEIQIQQIIAKCGRFIQRKITRDIRNTRKYGGGTKKETNLRRSTTDHAFVIGTTEQSTNEQSTNSGSYNYTSPESSTSFSVSLSSSSSLHGEDDNDGDENNDNCGYEKQQTGPTAKLWLFNSNNNHNTRDNERNEFDENPFHKRLCEVRKWTKYFSLNACIWESLSKPIASSSKVKDAQKRNSGYNDNATSLARSLPLLPITAISVKGPVTRSRHRSLSGDEKQNNSHHLLLSLPLQQQQKQQQDSGNARRNEIWWEEINAIGKYELGQNALVFKCKTNSQEFFALKVGTITSSSAQFVPRWYESRPTMTTLMTSTATTTAKTKSSSQQGNGGTITKEKEGGNGRFVSGRTRINTLHPTNMSDFAMLSEGVSSIMTSSNHDIQQNTVVEGYVLRLLAEEIVMKGLSPHIVCPIYSGHLTMDTFRRLDCFREHVSTLRSLFERHENDSELRRNEVISQLHNAHIPKQVGPDFGRTTMSTLSEWANGGSLIDFIKRGVTKLNVSIYPDLTIYPKQFTEMMWILMFFQITWTLFCVQKRFPSFRHNDLHGCNVLVQIHKHSENSNFLSNGSSNSARTTLSRTVGLFSSSSSATATAGHIPIPQLFSSLPRERIYATKAASAASAVREMPPMPFYIIYCLHDASIEALHINCTERQCQYNASAANSQRNPHLIQTSSSTIVPPSAGGGKEKLNIFVMNQTHIFGKNVVSASLWDFDFATCPELDIFNQFQLNSQTLLEANGISTIEDETFDIGRIIHGVSDGLDCAKDVVNPIQPILKCHKHYGAQRDSANHNATSVSAYDRNEPKRRHKVREWYLTPAQMLEIPQFWTQNSFQFLEADDRPLQKLTGNAACRFLHSIKRECGGNSAMEQGNGKNRQTILPKLSNKYSIYYSSTA